jgi:uncharacterized repeat protein (TIGR01451 family)
LTAAALQETPPPQGTGQGIPGCITTTTNLPQPDPAKTGALRLTSSKDNQASFVLIDNPIPSDQGLVVTFDFFTYNGDGADGISFFLIDGTVSPRQAGGFGGSLGYAQRTAEPPERPEDVPGIDGGYVGIGLDEFGNFSNPEEGRVGGPGQRPDSVAIRGRSGPFATGYRYLIGTGDPGATPLPGSIDTPGVTVRNAARRTARITLTPENQISVDIDFGRGFVNVIAPYDLSAAPGQGTLPRTFKFGFASSTGSSRNIHEIRNLLITSVAPDLSITKTGPESFSVGKQASYTLRVRNSRSGGPTTGPITVTDTLPPGFRFISATGRNWSCSAQGSQVTCNYADAALPLRPGAAAPPITITVLPTAAAGTPATNTADVSTPGDTNPTNNSDTVVIPVTAAPLLSAIKTAQLEDVNGNGLGDPGEVITYIIPIENRGNAPSTNTVLTDDVPANTTYVPNSTTLNGTPLADEAGTTPIANGQLVNSPTEPLANGTVNPGPAEIATVRFQVRITSPLPPGTTQIENQGSVQSDQENPPRFTAPTPAPDPGDPIPPPGPTIVPIIPAAPGEPRLRLVKRITQVNTTPYSNLINEPADPNDDPGIWPATLQPVGLTQLDPQAPLTSGDEVEYTVYFISDGTENAQNVQICDPIPAKTTFIPNSFGTGSGILLNQGGTQTSQTNVLDTDKGSFASPLAPVTAPPCPNSNNQNGSVLLQLGEVPNTAPNNAGFVRFRVKID